MAKRRRADPKTVALRQRGTLNPHPEHVRDDLFQNSEFFDSRDLLQVKYEMVRRVMTDGASVVGTAKAFGFSRPSFYAAQTALRKEGLGGLLPRKRGPRAGHKLTPEIVSFVEAVLAEDPSASTAALGLLIKERFGLEIHPRTIERALARQKKPR